MALLYCATCRKINNWGLDAAFCAFIAQGSVNNYYYFLVWS